jgi:hypothetical protein
MVVTRQLLRRHRRASRRWRPRVGSAVVSTPLSFQRAAGRGTDRSVRPPQDSGRSRSRLAGETRFGGIRRSRCRTKPRVATSGSGPWALLSNPDRGWPRGEAPFRGAKGDAGSLASPLVAGNRLFRRCFGSSVGTILKHRIDVSADIPEGATGVSGVGAGETPDTPDTPGGHHGYVIFPDSRQILSQSP